MANTKFDFHGLGIGQLLQRHRLEVPPNQRSYAWEDRQVTELFEDLKGAIDNNDEDYFLGTIVLIQNEEGSDILRVADGQQRLATTTILLARMRDQLFALGRDPRAQAVDSEFLRRIDKQSEKMVPRLQLNVEDHEFYLRTILPSPKETQVAPLSNLRLSNERLLTASKLAIEFIQAAVLAGLRPELHADRLLAWINFLETKATVVSVTAPNDIGAFRMFETLNDRGLKASQADILKNYFFSRAGGTRLTEVQIAWNATSSSIEAINDDDDDRLVLYLRHFWITTHGPTKDRELATEMKKEINNETKTLQFVFDIRDATDDYLAVWLHSSAKWAQGYKSSSRKSIQAIAEHLKVEQIRPLLFAVARKFDPAEADKALRLFVSWSVRFLIFGGRGGLLDRQYSLRAQDVGTGKITRARDLREAMKDYVPTDREFEEAFATARVSKPYLARYYLRAMDRNLKDDPEPEFVHNEDENEINLEHVLPLAGSKNWPVDEGDALTARKLLGNMVLLSASKNVKLGNLSFEEKRAIYAESSYSITQQVASYSKWTIDEIRHRQAGLAKIAIKTWPLTLAEK